MFNSPLYVELEFPRYKIYSHTGEKRLAVLTWTLIIMNELTRFGWRNRNFSFLENLGHENHKSCVSRPIRVDTFIKTKLHTLIQSNLFLRVVAQESENKPYTYLFQKFRSSRLKEFVPRMFVEGFGFSWKSREEEQKAKARVESPGPEMYARARHARSSKKHLCHANETYMELSRRCIPG